MQSLAPTTTKTSNNTVLAEFKARSLSNQFEMLKRRVSFDQQMHLSTNDSAADNKDQMEEMVKTTSVYLPTPPELRETITPASV